MVRTRARPSVSGPALVATLALAALVSAAGRTLLPGLIDAHTHAFMPGALESALAFGVTTQLDMFSSPDQVRSWKAEQASAPAPERDAAAGSDSTFRVLVYNIHAGKDAEGRPNLDRVAEVIRESGADVVLLQEVDRGTERSGGVDQLAALERATGLRGAFGKTLDYQGGGYGIAVLSRWPIRSDTLLKLPVSPAVRRAGGSTEPRGALVARLDAPWGEPLTVVNTHLDAAPDDPVRMQEAAALVSLTADARLDPPPTLLGGDLNAEPGSRVLERLQSAGLRDAWPGCGEGEGLTYPAAAPVRRIDYLLLPRGLACRRAEVLEADASDHRPVLFVLSRRHPDIPSP